MSIKLKDTIYDLVNNADKIDGLDSTSLFRKLGSNVDINTFADGSNKNGIIYINTTTPADINAPFSYGTILSFNSDAGSWMLGNSSSGVLKFRNRWWSGNGATWSDWKDIAFKTDIPTIPTALKNPKALTIQNNGTTVDSYDGSAAKTINITHPTIPTALKCPTSLTIQFNGTSQGAWDGSTAKTINITPAAIGAADSSHNHSNHLSLAAYNLSSGCLVKTDIPTASNTMITFRIEGNSYGSKTILTTGHFYNYNDNNQILSADATNHGYGFGDISVFCYSNNVYLWFKQQSNYQSFIVYVYSSNYGTSGLNRAVSISNSAIPSSGVTRKVVITPKISLDSSNWSSYCAPASHTHSYLPLSGGTLTGNMYFGSDSTSYNQTGTSSIFPAHFYRNCWDASGNVYDHYYNPAYTASTNTTANLRVKSSGGFKVLTFSGNGGFTWDGNTVITSGNWSSYCAAKSHTHDYAASSHTHTFASLTSKPTTISGFGITDAYTPAKYTTTAQPSGYYKIKINSTTYWMMGFRVRVYKSYQYFDIRFSGYNYGSYYWYSPVASLVDGDAAITVYFGYDSASNLWVGIPAGNYTGIEITDVVNGYYEHGKGLRLDSLFTITQVSSLGGTTQSTQTIQPPSKSGHTHDYAASNHTHSYAASSHTHTKSQITDFSHTHDYAASNHSHSGYMTTSSPTGSGTLMMNGSNSRGSFPAVKWHIGNVNWAQLIMNGSGELELRGGASQDAGYATLRTGAMVCTSLYVGSDQITFTT